MSWRPYPPAVALAATTRRAVDRLAEAFHARTALRPDGSGAGMNLPETNVLLAEEIRELMAEIRGLRADLRHFRESSEDD